jgi:hypothetical protein
MGEPKFSDSSCTGGPPLVLGGARGRRAFYLDSDGWMRGVTYRYPWVDGENVAECMVTKKVNVMAKNMPSTLWGVHAPYDVGGVRFHDDPSVPHELGHGYEWDKCEGLGAECACGFYAYHDGHTQYAMSGPGCRVQAVVEAYGRVVVGTLGYRAEKARILGVVKPPETEAARRRHSMEESIKSLEETLAAVKARPGALLGRNLRRVQVMAVLGALVAAVAPLKVAPAFLFYAGALVTCSYIFKRVFKVEYDQTVAAIEQAIKSYHEQIAALPVDYSSHLEKAMANYPSVRWFDTFQELMEAFPCESLKPLVTKEESDG